MAREEGTENLREVLEQTILEEDNKLFDEDIGDERNAIAKNLVDFYKLKLEEDKLAQEHDLKMKEILSKESLSKKEMGNKERELDLKMKEILSKESLSKKEMSNKERELDLKMREILSRENLSEKEMSHKKRELDIRERELELSKANSKMEFIKSGLTLVAWAGLSIGVMVFESNGGAILSKAFPGIFPKTKI